jgi:hypothetical protein
MGGRVHNSNNLSWILKICSVGLQKGTTLCTYTHKRSHINHFPYLLFHPKSTSPIPPNPNSNPSIKRVELVTYLKTNHQEFLNIPARLSHPIPLFSSQHHLNPHLTPPKTNSAIYTNYNPTQTQPLSSIIAKSRNVESKPPIPIPSKNRQIPLRPILSSLLPKRQNERWDVVQHTPTTQAST